MRILFDSALDGRTWFYWPDGQQGQVGEIKTGRLGLLGIMETILGMRGPTETEGIRVASLVPVIQNYKKSFWAASAEVDPFRVAQELIYFHDFLSMHGWQKQPLTPKLADLACLSDKILPGIPERLQTVITALDDYTGQLPDLTLLEPPDRLPLLWQNIFNKLDEKKGVCIITDTEKTNGNEGDLNTAKNGLFIPSGDGSLQLIRPTGVLMAADNLASWLAQVAKEDKGLHDTVIIGGDAVLDRALRRFGLATTGAKPDDTNSLTQLLPLVLALGWSPPNPARIMELLTMPISPIPTGINCRLIKALIKWPALGSQVWQENLTEGLASIKNQDKRKRVEERLQIIFTSTAHDEYPLGEINRRLAMLTSWLRRHFKDDSVSQPVFSQCHIFEAMVAALGLNKFSEPLLKQLQDEASSAAKLQPIFTAQAGLAAVLEPEAIIGPVKRIIWWNFTRDSVSSLKCPILSSEEQQQLTAAGSILPDTAYVATTRALRWRRPLDFATEQLILVCPQQDAGGNKQYPHPLWDELLAASQGEARTLVHELIVHSLDVPLITPASISLPETNYKWQVTQDAIKPRDQESPSSLEIFLGCPLNWCFNYQALIRRSHTATLPTLAPTLGRLAHDLVEEVLLQSPLPLPEDGAKLAEKLFSKKTPQLVAELYQEGMEPEQENICNTVVMATRSLLQHLHDAGVQKLTIEQNLSGTFGTQNLQGQADIVVDKPFTVIDLKRSYASFFKKKMISGTALQIVLYGWLLKEAKGVFPELAYFTLEDQTFLTTDHNHFSNGEKVQTPASTEVWQAFKNTYNGAWQVLQNGLVLCPGNGEEVKVELKDGSLTLEPPCKFCEYDVLCGRRFS